MREDPNRVDPDKWQPLIMSFQEFYGLSPRKAHESRLAEIPERLYRSPDIERAHAGDCPRSNPSHLLLSEHRVVD